MEEEVEKYKTAIGISSVTNLIRSKLPALLRITAALNFLSIFLGEHVRVFVKIWQQ
jgi:hypothetical protein